MDPSALLAFLLVDLLLVLTPGADWAYAIRAGVARQHVAAAVGGLAAGYVVHAVLVALGVGALLAGRPAALAALTLAGALYLVWLGVRTVREPGAGPHADGVPPARWPAVAVRGALVSGLNPKGLLLFLAVLPQFVRPDAVWPVPAQLALLGAVHVAACVLAYAAVARVAGATLAARPRAARVVGRASGLLMAGVGAALAVGQVTA